MITGKDVYEVFTAIVPLYAAMILAHGSVRWWKIFTPDQCSGINRFVALFAVPLLSFRFISSNHPYAMNYKFLLADSLQKVVILVALFLWQAFSKGGNLEWMITLFSLSTLPNTLVMGIPLLKAMYGDFSGTLMVQIVVLQSVICGREPLQTDAEIGDDGKLHVVVKRSNASSFNRSHRLNSLNSMTSRASNLTGVEIYSVQSSLETTPRGSSFNQTDFYAMFSASKAPSRKHGYTNSFQGRFGDDEEALKMSTTNKKRRERSMSCEVFNGGMVSSNPPPNPMFSRSTSGVPKKKDSGGGEAVRNKDLHMFVWNSSASPDSEGNLRHAVNRAASTDFAVIDPSKAAALQQHETTASKGMHDLVANMSPGRNTSADTELDIEEGSKFPASASPYGSFRKKVSVEDGGVAKNHQMPRARLFMALQPKIIACGKSVATFAMAVRFLAGPAVIAGTSIAVGLRGVLLHVSILQAALPQGIVPFVFAKEYNVHADILSTAVIFGMLLAVPVTIIYYILLGL
ncbi:hypothetical protein ACE6H2_000635 [Prunus campanulata]